MFVAAVVAATHPGYAQQAETSSGGGAQNAETSPAPGTAEDAETSASATKESGDLDVKNVFRNVCSFCHQDYGRKAGKGPQLMDSSRSDEYLFNMIKHGKPGRMAAFGSQFTDDQIREIVQFIRELEPDQVPSG
jgi:mono/diheme cytochrome c family protein